MPPPVRLPTMPSALLLAALAATASIDLASAIQLSPSERMAAEHITMLSQTHFGREYLQSLLSKEEVTRQELEYLSGVGGRMHQEEEMLDAATREGKGFKIPFYPKNSTVFNPLKSTTFRVVCVL